MTPTTQEIREHYSGSGYGAHFDGCWKLHVHCCIRMLCDEVERLEAELAVARATSAIASEDPRTRR